MDSSAPMPKCFWTLTAAAMTSSVRDDACWNKLCIRTVYQIAMCMKRDRLAFVAAGCDLKVLKRSAGGIATRRARPIRFVRVLAAGFAALRAFPPIRFAHLRRIFDPRPLASFHYTLTFHSCAATNRIGRIDAGCSVITQSQTLDAVAPHLSPRSTDWPFESKS